MHAIEADDSLSRLLDRVEAGEEVVITRHGKAVARRARSAAGRRQAPPRRSAR